MSESESDDDASVDTELVNYSLNIENSFEKIYFEPKMNMQEVYEKKQKVAMIGKKNSEVCYARRVFTKAEFKIGYAKEGKGG